MTHMIERVAKAIEVKIDELTAFRETPVILPLETIDLARAAIAAMREEESPQYVVEEGAKELAEEFMRRENKKPNG